MAKDKTSSNSYENRRNGSMRGGYARALAVEWLRLHRPDVMEGVMAEAYKKYPTLGVRRSEKIKLSKELVNLK